MRQRVSMFGLVGAFLACGCSGGDGNTTLVDDGPISKSQGALKFSEPNNYTETRGLPAGPVAQTVSLEEFIRLIEPAYKDLAAELRKKYESFDLRTRTVRILESYVHDRPVYLKGDRAYLPATDPVVQPGTPEVSAKQLSTANCFTTHVCETFYEATSTGKPAYDLFVIVGWNVEVAGPTITNGASVLVVADNFRSSLAGAALKTGVLDPKYYPGEPEKDGRKGRAGGAFMLYANVLDSVDIDTSGQSGENGPAGHNAQGFCRGERKYVNGKWKGVCHREIQEGVESRKAGSGHDGGPGSDGGAVMLRYVTLPGQKPLDAAV